MLPLTISLLQLDQVWENKSLNQTRISELTQGLTTDLLLIPEMMDTGFSMNTQLAETWDSSNGSLAFILALAQRIGGAVYTSLMVNTSMGYVNRGVWATPDGEASFYDKRKTFKLAGEDRHFLSGESEAVVSYKGWKINLQVCFDLRFPELVRNALIQGKPRYDLLLYVANWPEKRILHWDALLRARAIENQCVVAAVNRVGVDGNQLHYSGNSSVIGMDGSEWLPTPKHQEGLFSTVLNPEEVINYRQKLPFLEENLDESTNTLKLGVNKKLNS